MCFYGFCDQVKEGKVKKVKEMNPGPLPSSDNVLLSEKSFISREDKPIVANGYRQEWVEKMANSVSQYQDIHSKVDNRVFLVKLCICTTHVFLQYVVMIVICFVTRLLTLRTLLKQHAERCMLMLMILIFTPSQIIGKLC